MRFDWLKNVDAKTVKTIRDCAEQLKFEMDKEI
jgi:hypothetical protein